jgi:hypothetical protein
MKHGKTLLVAVAVTGVLGWQGLSVAAPDGQNSTDSLGQGGMPNTIQTPMDASGYKRRGVPGGYKLIKVDKNALTKEQHAKIQQLLEDEAKQFQALSRDRSIPKEKKPEAARQIRETTQVKIKALLTPEQLKNYEAAEEEDRAFREKLLQKKLQKQAVHQKQVRQDATNN